MNEQRYPHMWTTKLCKQKGEGRRIGYLEVLLHVSNLEKKRCWHSQYRKRRIDIALISMDLVNDSRDILVHSIRCHLYWYPVLWNVPHVFRNMVYTRKYWLLHMSESLGKKCSCTVIFHKRFSLRKYYIISYS